MTEELKEWEPTDDELRAAVNNYLANGMAHGSLKRVGSMQVKYGKGRGIERHFLDEVAALEDKYGCKVNEVKAKEWLRLVDTLSDLVDGIIAHSKACDCRQCEAYRKAEKLLDELWGKTNG